MSQRSNLAILIAATSSFVGGFALGLLLSPRSGQENREWISDQTTHARDWVDEKGKDLIHKGEEQFQRLGENVRDEFKKNVPDLYEATENIDMHGDKIIDG